MIRILVIVLLALICFSFQVVFAFISGGWLKANLLIVLIVFLNLYLGIRYAILAALFCGILQDSFGIYPFGLGIVAFLFCAYMTIFIKRFLDYRDSRMSRIVIVLSICIINTLLHYVLLSIFSNVDFRSAVWSVMLPEVIVTMAVAGFMFRALGKTVRYIRL